VGVKRSTRKKTLTRDNDDDDDDDDKNNNTATSFDTQGISSGNSYNIYNTSDLQVLALYFTEILRSRNM
jgi:uncharacterized protein YgiM (DUF1202 family)